MADAGAEDAEGRLGLLRFAVFGPVRAWRGEEPLDVGPARQRAVLAVLLLHANRPVGRERLIQAVWGDPAPAYAVNQLQKYVSGLRRVLEPGRAARSRSGVLVWSGDGYVLRVGPDGLDLTVFERRVARGREALLRGDVRGAAGELEGALALWAGPVLEGVSSVVLDGERERLAELRTAVLEERIDADLELGRHGRLVPELTRLVAEFPLRERCAALLMVALFRAGRQGEALAVYDTARKVLGEELGIDPGPELRRRHRQILAGDAALGGDDAGVAVAATQDRVRQEQVPAPRRAETAEELAIRLDDARRLQIKAGDEARGAYALVFWLLELVNSLQERVARLEAEKRSRAAAPGLTEELAASRGRLVTARKQLVRARREREKAEEVRLATRRLVEERLRDRGTDRRPEPETAETDRGQFAGAEELGLAPLYEVDHLLEVSEERLREQAAQLDELSGKLDLTVPAEEGDAGQRPEDVVRGELLDGAAGTDAAGRAGRADTVNSPSQDGGSPGREGEHGARGSDAEPPAGRRDAKAARTGRDGWLWVAGCLGAVTAFVLVLSSLVSYGSRRAGLEYDVGSLPVKEIKGSPGGGSSAPSYVWRGVRSHGTLTSSGDLWATFAPFPRSPVMVMDRRFTARLVFSAPEAPGSGCPDETAGVGWTITIDGEREIASGVLGRRDGESAAISAALPSDPGTITLTATGAQCEYGLRLERPVIRYRGLWERG
ncbi:hypothetical protein HCC61_29385 [Streptomyces sp. HNM0575]|nr:hypothetical protein [Streptomyces sp. HNM0575]